jgi:hypothetical protein
MKVYLKLDNNQFVYTSIGPAGNFALEIYNEKIVEARVFSRICNEISLTEALSFLTMVAHWLFN